MKEVKEDISMLMQAWSYDPKRVKVRRIQGEDGIAKLQMRIDLGILQMEMFGRPDGKRPHGYPSLLEYHEQRLKEFISTHASPIGFSLTTRQCTEIRMESLQYYYRYLGLYHLGDYEGVLRDTDRNLRTFDFVKNHAGSERDRNLLEQYRPYVFMMQIRAQGYLCLKSNGPRLAVRVMNDGIARIEKFFSDCGCASVCEKCEEIQLLRRMVEEIEKMPSQPPCPIRRLREEMRQAVYREDYEQAGFLRDEIKRLEQIKAEQAGENS